MMAKLMTILQSQVQSLMVRRNQHTVTSPSLVAEAWCLLQGMAGWSSCHLWLDLAWSPGAQISPNRIPLYTLNTTGNRLQVIYQNIFKSLSVLFIPENNKCGTKDPRMKKVLT